MLGRVDYPATVAAMQRFTEERTDETPDELWICEHPAVYTQGLAGKSDHVLSPGGIPGDDVAAYYRRRAEGGVGLIVTEGTGVERTGSVNDPNVPNFFGAALPGWGKVVTAFAVRGDLDVQGAQSNTFELEWPPRSGTRVRSRSDRGRECRRGARPAPVRRVAARSCTAATRCR